MDKQSLLKEKVSARVTHIPHSREHPLKTIKSRVKREDELGFGISGTKLRKYTSLIPHLINNSYQAAAIIGSAHSNHVLSISQTLIENDIKPVLFLLGNPKMKREGNLLLTSMLVPETEWHWIDRTDWPFVEKLAYEHITKETLLIPEGACMPEALPGALTLAIDMLDTDNDHIFMDAGTGLSAIATILAYAWLGKKTTLHILLLADNEQQFLNKLNHFQHVFEQFMGASIEGELRFKLYSSTLARSFGSVNQAVIDHIKFLACNEGFFTDPIYSAKLFWEANEIIKAQSLDGNILVIHSGGALTLMGFQQHFQHKDK